MFVDQSFFSQVYGDITSIITFMINNKKNVLIATKN